MVRYLAGALLAACLRAQTEQDGSFLIAVSDEATGQPVPGVRVVLHADAPRTAQPVTTGQHGTARITGLAPGSYLVYLSRADYVSSAEGGPHYRITVRQGETALAASIQPKAAVSGRVVGEDNEPIEGVQIRAERETGIPMLATSGKGGEYRIAHMRPGAYRFLLLFPNARIRASLLTKDKERWGYPNASWHPGVEAKADAAVAVLTQGMSVTGLDLRVRREHLVEIAGHLVDADTRQPLTNASIEIEPLAGGFVDESLGRRTVTHGSAAFSFPFARPGRHWLLIYRGDQRNSIPYIDALDAGRAGLSGHLVRVPRFSRIEGRIKPPPPAGSRIALAGPRVGLGHQESVIAADGSFVFENVPPGSVRLAADFVGHWVESIRFGDRTVAATGWMHELIVPEAPVSDLEVKISNRMGTLSGRVVDDKGNPVPQHRVALSPYRYGGALTDQYGDFRLAELRPGAYEVSACAGKQEKVRIEAGTAAAVVLRACTQR